MRAESWRVERREFLRRLRWPLALTLLVASAAIAHPLILADAPTPRAPMRLVLNIPAYRLDVLRDEVVVRSFPVAVGMLRYPTPAGEFTIGRIVWNRGGIRRIASGRAGSASPHPAPPTRWGA